MRTVRAYAVTGAAEDRERRSRSARHAGNTPVER
jgi:hypothetical protein